VKEEKNDKIEKEIEMLYNIIFYFTDFIVSKNLKEEFFEHVNKRGIGKKEKQALEATFDCYYCAVFFS
jgi:hypothetical protein